MTIDAAASACSGAATSIHAATSACSGAATAIPRRPPPQSHPVVRRRSHTPPSAAASTSPPTSPPRCLDLASRTQPASPISPPRRPAPADTSTLHASAASPPWLPSSASVPPAVHASGLPSSPFSNSHGMEGVAPSAMVAGRLRRPQTRWFLSLLASKKNSAAHDSPAKNTRSKQCPLSKRTRRKSDGRYCPRQFTVKTIHYVGECGFNFHFNSFRGCCVLGVGTTSAVCNMKVELESLQFSSRKEINWNWIRIRKQPSRPFDQLQQQQSMVGQMEKVASPQVDLRCSGDRFCS